MVLYHKAQSSSAKLESHLARQSVSYIFEIVRSHRKWSGCVRFVCENVSAQSAVTRQKTSLKKHYPGREERCCIGAHEHAAALKANATERQSFQSAVGRSQLLRQEEECAFFAAASSRENGT